MLSYLVRSTLGRASTCPGWFRDPCHFFGGASGFADGAPAAPDAAGAAEPLVTGAALEVCAPPDDELALLDALEEPDEVAGAAELEGLALALASVALLSSGHPTNIERLVNAAQITIER